MIPEPMDTLVYPCRGLSGEWNAPPSKNYTTRMILGAALARGHSVVHGAADNMDSDVLLGCLTALGVNVVRRGTDVHIFGCGGELKPPRRDLDVGNAGAVCRFLMALAPLAGHVRFVTRYTDSLGRRPHDGLLRALEQLGVEVVSAHGSLPVELRAGPLAGGEVTVDGSVSSQYLSGLLFLAPLLPNGLRIHVTPPLKSQAAVQTTLDVLNRFGIRTVSAPDLLFFEVPGGQSYCSGEFAVPGDYPAAAAIAAICAMVPSKVSLRGLEDDCQAEKAAIPLLEHMGLGVSAGPGVVTLTGDGRPLRPVECDGDRIIDAVLSVAVAATRADGMSRIHNVANLRVKESDRISDFRREMQRLGVRIDEGPGELIIWGPPALGLPGEPHVHCHHDHRLVMAFTAAALAAPCCTVIHESHEVAKSYPRFFDDLSALGACFKHLHPAG